MSSWGYIERPFFPPGGDLDLRNSERLLSERLSKLRINWPTRQHAARLRKQADKLEQSRQPRRPKHPPLTNDDKAELKRLCAAIQRIQIRHLERMVAELEDIRNSPTALRHIADEMDAYLNQEEQRKEQFRRETTGEDALSVLNLRSNATPDEIRARYRVLVKQLHPDTNSGNATTSAQLQQVITAMDRLRAAGRV